MLAWNTLVGIAGVRLFFDEIVRILGKMNKFQYLKAWKMKITKCMWKTEILGQDFMACIWFDVEITKWQMKIIKLGQYSYVRRGWKEQNYQV